MMPRSHFLFGILFGAIASFFFPQITLRYVFLAGIAGVLVDIDHFVSHMIATGDLTPTGMWKRCFNDKYKKHLKAPHYRSRFVHGWRGLLIISLLLVPVFWITPLVAVALCAGYYSHLVADWISGRSFYGHINTCVLEVKHFTYPVIFDELVIDVFVFDLAMIILLYRGLI